MTDDMPTVSVILPTFNRSELVPRAIASVLEQTLTSFELIVVDDCSSDDTPAVVAGIPDERIRLLRHDKNLGLAEARNSGIRQARGRFVSFLDDDDELLPDKLMVQVSAFDEGKDMASVVMACQAIVDDGISSNVRPPRAMRVGEPLCEYLMCGEGGLPIHAVMLTSEFARNNLFAPGQRRLEDYSWLLRLEERDARFVLIEEPLVVWHVDINRFRLSRSITFEQAYEWLEACGSAVTPKARQAFLAREVAPFVDPRGNHLKVVRMICGAVVSRSISRVEGAKALLKATLPPKALHRLRRVFRRDRFG